jgi:hypothetical protein
MQPAIVATLRRLSFLSAALAFGCGGSADSAPQSADAGRPATTAVPDASSVDGTSASPTGRQGSSSTCSLTVSGAIEKSAIFSASATIGATVDGQTELSCAVTAGDGSSARLVFGSPRPVGGAPFPNPGVGTLSLPAYFQPDCPPHNESCAWTSPDDYNYWTTGDTLCNLGLDTFAPMTRGGLQASLSCPDLVMVDQGTETHISISGLIDMPPAADAPLAPADVGDGGIASKSCHAWATGQYTMSAYGDGYWIDGNDYLVCDVSAGGIAYEVGINGPGGPYNGAAGVGLDGATWCASGCEIDYLSQAPACTVDILLDEGVGGRFVADFDCPSLTASDGTSLAVGGHVDGIHQPAPVPQ